MEQPFLTEARFNRFEDKFDQFIKELDDRNLRVENRITALETNQKNAGWLATWISMIVASIVTYVFTTFGIKQ
jgi:hypothetical protein